MDLDRSDVAGCMRYRTAYGLAADLVEASKLDLCRGRAFAARVGDEHEDILAAVIERIGDDRRDLVELAVADAVEGRRPRW